MLTNDWQLRVYDMLRCFPEHSRAYSTDDIYFYAYLSVRYACLKIARLARPARHRAPKEKEKKPVTFRELLTPRKCKGEAELRRGAETLSFF